MGLDVNKEMSKRNTKLYDCLNSTYGDYLTIMVNQIFTKLPTAAANVLFIFLILCFEIKCVCSRHCKRNNSFECETNRIEEK